MSGGVWLECLCLGCSHLFLHGEVALKEYWDLVFMGE